MKQTLVHQLYTKEKVLAPMHVPFERLEMIAFELPGGHPGSTLRVTYLVRPHQRTGITADHEWLTRDPL